MSGIGNLSVKVAAKTGGFQAGMQAAQSALSGLRNDAIQTAGSMQLLQGRMDEAGDEAQTAGMKAGASSGGFMALASSAASAEISFGSLSVITAATLIPSLLALSAVVAPLTAALGGFLVVAGSITGVGLAGFLGAVMTNGEQLKATFDRLTATIRDEFAPVFDIFAGVLDRLMKSLIDIIPQLVPAEDAVRRIAGQFEQLGMAMIEVLPAFVDLAVTLADQFLPPFVEWVERILPKVAPFLRSLIPTMLKVGDAMSPLVQAFIDIGPPMTKFGMTVLNLIVPTLRTAVKIFSRTMGFVNGLDKSTSKLVTTMVILAPIVGTLVSTLGTMAAPILAVVAAIGIFVSAWVNGWDKTKRMISSGVTTITNAFNGIVDWLVANGPGMVNKAVGIFQAMIRDAGAWIRENGPGITKKAFKLVGKAIRLACLEIYNAITGNDDSILRSIIKDSASWMINKGPGILKEAAEYALDAIMAAGKGLYEGLIGNSLIPDMFEDIASYIRTTAKSLVSGAIDAVVDSVKTAFSYLTGTGSNSLLGDVKGTLSSIESEAKNWVDDFTQPFQDAKNDVERKFSDLKETLVGNSIVPDMLNDMITEGEGWVGDFTSPFQDAKESVLSEFSKMKDGATDAASGIGETINEISKKHGEFNAAATKEVFSSLGTSDLKTLAREATKVEDKKYDANPVEGNYSKALGMLRETKQKGYTGTEFDNVLDKMGDSGIYDTLERLHDTPQLDTGGYIEQDGLAQLHAGERVVRAAEVERDGGGGKTINIEVDARGSDNPGQTKRNAKRGLSSALDAYNV